MEDHHICVFFYLLLVLEYYLVYGVRGRESSLGVEWCSPLCKSVYEHEEIGKDRWEEWEEGLEQPCQKHQQRHHIISNPPDDFHYILPFGVRGVRGADWLCLCLCAAISFKDSAMYEDNMYIAEFMFVGRVSSEIMNFSISQHQRRAHIHIWYELGLCDDLI